MRRIFLILFFGLSALAALVFYIKFDRQNQARFSVTFFNIGQGDAALIKFASGEKILVDCGPDRKILSKLGGALPFYDKKIDFLIVTHPDLDHYGGCLDVLKKYEVKNVITNGVRKDGDRYWQIWDDYARQNFKVSDIAAPEKLAVAGHILEFLAPDSAFDRGAADKEGNNSSIVFKLITSSTTFFFAGDMETPLEKCLVAKYCLVSAAAGCPKLKSDILKVGHHGSDSSTGRELLEAVRPQRAVISVGQNTFGHPSLRVLKKLERARINILRTDEAGDIIME